ncbi:hypothetical protein [Pseudorhodoferax sp.]|uniref:hypothetical protein n=1 Tax=Pseudorhodoferax sp. TaxID=1993553 RepID=UPI0039E50199
MKYKIYIAMGSMAFFMAGFAAAELWKFPRTTRIHVLQTPLLLASPDASAGLHMLPKGTTLYFDKAYPEGFTRYRIYVNVDRMPLALEELADSTEIIPVEAYPPDREDLRRLLAGYPLTRDELAAILKSNRFERQEIRSLLQEYSQ